MRTHVLVLVVIAGAFATAGCGPPPPGPVSTPTVDADAVAPDYVFHQSGRITIGAPLAVAVDFEGIAYVADASPARLLSIDGSTDTCDEYQKPEGIAGFYPTDVAVRGFFVYAVNETDRTLLRWDNSGGYRDVLVNFQLLTPARRVSPHGLAVDASGRIAVTDIENHQVLLLNTYLQLDVAFGNYGSFPGQFDTPRGVSFTRDGELLVTDTGNRRVQLFSDGGTLRRVIPEAGAPNPLKLPRRAVQAPDGRIFVADPGAGRLFIFSASGALQSALVPEGVASFEPTDVAIVRGEQLFVTDATSASLYVFKVK